MNSTILEVTNKPLFDDAITRLEYHSHQSYSTSKFEANDETRISIQTQDVFTLPCESFLYIEGSTEGEQAARVKYVSNAIAFMFDEIRYEIAGVEVDRVTNVGITSTIKNYLTLNDAESKKLENAGWGTNFGTNNKNSFSVCIPLKTLMGFFEDYKKIVLNVKQELIMVRSNTDKNMLIKAGVEAVDGGKFSVNVNKLCWYVPYVQVSDDIKLQLLKIVNSSSTIDLCYRTWEMYQYPELPTTNRHTWSVKTSYNLERPRYIIVAFQTNRENQIDMDSSQFDHCNITNMKVFLNSEIYPYNNLQQNFTKKQVALLYDMYCKFQASYYGHASEPLVNISDFINKAPLFVIDCSKQTEALKSTTVDLRIEFEASENFPVKTRAHCLIVHDRLLKYNPLTNIVNKII